ncbi:MAG: CcmD family protein [Vicinamibacterales bacterium]
MTMTSFVQRAAIAAAIVLLLVDLVSPAHAIPLQVQPDPQGEWQRVTPGSAPVEQLPATPFVLYAYGFVWVAILGYLWTIWRRLNRVREELSSLERRVAGGAGRR